MALASVKANSIFSFCQLVQWILFFLVRANGDSLHLDRRPISRVVALQ